MDERTGQFGRTGVRPLASGVTSGAPGAAHRRSRLVTIEIAPRAPRKPRVTRETSMPTPHDADPPPPTDWSISMAQKPKPVEIDPRTRTDKLRELRLADEAARKEAGTWGLMIVGEVVHAASRSVYVQVWKGARRPDVALAPSARAAGVPPEDWTGLAAWIKSTRGLGLTRNVVAWSLSKAEALRVKAARIDEHRAAGLTVINGAEAAAGSLAAVAEAGSAAAA